MQEVVIDYETYWDDEVSVSEMGNVNYTAAADAYIVAVTVGNKVHCGTIAEMGPTMEQMVKDPTLQFWAANSNFDQGWTEKYWGSTVNPWECILDLGSFNQMPHNLAGLAKAALGHEVDKSTRDKMKGVRYEELDAENRNLVENYCIGDVQESVEILQTLPRMSAIEQKIAAYTRMANRRGVYVDTELVAADKTRLEQMRFDALKAIPWHRDAKPLSYPQLKLWCNANGIPVPKSTAKTDEECANLMSEHPKLNEVLSTLRRFRRSNTMLKKVQSLTQRVTPESILPLDIIYCGASHTRRWSSQGFNIQNLDKESFETGNGQSVWSRNWIKPRPGKKFLILDYAQIEPRVLNWLVGNEDMMEALRNGFSIYEAYARMVRNWKGAAGSIKAEYGKQKYTLLKNEVIGLSYGMGADRFVEYSAENGATVSVKDAASIVADYRKRNPKIVGLWRQLDNLIRNAVKDKEKTLSIDLPTGDTLKNFGVRASKGRYQSFTIKGDHSGKSLQPSLWGGVLTENVTQRTARDILANAVVRMENAGLCVLWTSHDEAILEVDDDASAPGAKAEAEQIMLTPPEWCSDLPLGVEGDWAMAYTK